MLNKETLDLFGTVINFGHFFGYSPFSYSSKKRRCHLHRSKWNRLRFVLCVTIILTYQLFLILRSVQTCFFKGKLSQSERSRSLYLPVIYVLFNFNTFLIILQYQNLHKIINAFLITGAKLSGGVHTDTDASKDQKQNVRLSRWIIFVGAFISISRAATVFSKPQSPELFTSFTSQPKSLPFLVKFVVAMIHLYITGFPLYLFTLNAMTIFCYVMAILPILNRMKIVHKLKKNYLRRHHSKQDKEAKSATWSTSSSSSVELSPDWLYNSFTQLSVLQQNFTAVYGSWPIGFEVALCTMSTVNLYLAIMTGNVRQLIIGVSASFTLVMFFTRFAEIFKVSTEAVSSWKMAGPGVDDKGFQDWFRKFQKSAKPIRVKVGNFFYVDKGLVLTLISIIVNTTTNLILAH